MGGCQKKRGLSGSYPVPARPGLLRKHTPPPCARVSIPRQCRIEHSKRSIPSTPAREHGAPARVDGGDYKAILESSWRPTVALRELQE